MEDRTRAICGDCMDYLKTLEDKSIPLVVADPPYGIGAGCAIGGAVRAKTHEYHCYEDKAVDLNLLSELIRVGRHVVIWGANHFISRLPIDASCWLVWDKMNGATDFADCELAWTNLEKPVRMFRFKWQGMLKGRQDVRQERIHPNEKPIALYRWIYNLVGLETCRGGCLTHSWEAAQAV